MNAPLMLPPPAQETAGKRAPPANIEAEQALLGAILYDNEAFHRVEGLQAGHFYEPFHGRLWSAISTAAAKGHIADAITLGDKFAADTAYQELGGIRYLADLLDRAPPATSAPSYAATIIDVALRRDVARIGAEAIERTERDQERTGREILDQVEQDFFALGDTTQRQGFRPFSEYLTEAVNHAAEAFSRDGSLSGLSTGLMDLDRKIGGLHPSDLVILAARPSMGKAQGLDAKVLMRDGCWKRMGDLRIGDDLASIDGAPSRVVGIFPQGERQTYRVTLSDGRSTAACGEHLWAVRSAKLPHGEAIVSTDQLREMLTKERFRRRVTLPLVSGAFGHDRDLYIDPWLLGALIGNGSMTPGRLSFSTADAATLSRLQAAIGADRVIPTGEAGYDYRLNDAELRSALRHYGLLGSASADKFIPADYLTAPRQARLELLRGLLDTDGWVEGFGAVRFATSSQRLAKDVQALVRSLGGTCTAATKQPQYTHKGEKRDGLTSHVLNISHPDRASLLSLTRKRRRCARPMRFRAPSVVAIEPETVEPVQCIRVTHPSALYVTDDYVVTHNTALAVNVAFDAAKHYRYEVQPDGSRKTVAGGVVAFFSHEMSGDQLAMRILAEASGVSGDRLRKGEIDANDFGRIRDAAELINTIPLHIDDSAGLSVGQLAARARRLKRLHGLDLVVVDYLQLLRGNKRYGGGQRVEEVSEITVGLKALAKDLGVPVLALSQLSRQVETREDKRPQLSDLRESGSIEQDADMVMFLYREAYYLSRKEPATGTPEHLTWQEEMAKVSGQAEIIVGKQRHGPIGTVHVAFNDATTKFSNLARDVHFGASRLPYGEGD